MLLSTIPSHFFTKQIDDALLTCFEYSGTVDWLRRSRFCLPSPSTVARAWNYVVSGTDWEGEIMNQLKEEADKLVSKYFP